MIRFDNNIYVFVSINFIVTVLILMNSNKPARANSLPKPLSLIPAKGQMKATVSLENCLDFSNKEIF